MTLHYQRHKENIHVRIKFFPLSIVITVILSAFASQQKSFDGLFESSMSWKPPKTSIILMLTLSLFSLMFLDTTPACIAGIAEKEI
jgi:hypothetical protein